MIAVERGRPDLLPVVVSDSTGKPAGPARKEAAARQPVQARVQAGHQPGRRASGLRVAVADQPRDAAVAQLEDEAAQIVHGDAAAARQRLHLAGGKHTLPQVVQLAGVDLEAGPVVVHVADEAPDPLVAPVHAALELGPERMPLAVRMRESHELLHVAAVEGVEPTTNDLDVPLRHGRPVWRAGLAQSVNVYRRVCGWSTDRSRRTTYTCAVPGA